MRALVPSSLFQELTSWHRDIDELFDRFFSLGRSDGDRHVIGWVPAMETFAKDGNYCVRLDLPGVDPKDVEVSVVGDSLVVRGERKQTQEIKDQDLHYREISYGRFERALTLPKGTNPEKIAARYENGVLEISMPLSEALAGRKVPIQIAGPTAAQQAA
jgi:HSP20 family protein